MSNCEHGCNGCENCIDDPADSEESPMTQQTQEQDKLEPCPFCGGGNLDVIPYAVQPDDYHAGHVYCNDCETEGPSSLSLPEPDGCWMPDPESAKEEAIKAWNRRAGQTVSAQAVPQEIANALDGLIRAAVIEGGCSTERASEARAETEARKSVLLSMLAAAPQPEAQAAPPLVLDAERAAHYSQVVHHANVNASVSYVQRKTGLSFMLVGELMELALKNGDIAKGDYAGRKLEHYQDDRVASLQARIAELEAARDAKQAVQMPEPVAFALEWTFNGEERGMRLYDDETHCRFDAESDGGVCNPLYTEQQVRAMLATNGAGACYPACNQAATSGAAGLTSGAATEVAAAIDRFDAYFRSANGVPSNARVSAPTAEWQELRAMLNDLMSEIRTTNEAHVSNATLAAAPAAPVLQPLTLEQMQKALGVMIDAGSMPYAISRAIERAHGIGAP